MSRRLCPETRPEHCFDWITPDEAVRMVVKAYAVARQHVYPPSGERFREPGDDVPWACREDFANALSDVLGMQVRTLAYRLGIAEDRFEAEAVRLAKWQAEPYGAVLASEPLSLVWRAAR